MVIIGTKFRHLNNIWVFRNKVVTNFSHSLTMRLFFCCGTVMDGVNVMEWVDEMRSNRMHIPLWLFHVHTSVIYIWYVCCTRTTTLLQPKLLLLLMSAPIHGWEKKIIPSNETIGACFVSVSEWCATTHVHYGIESNIKFVLLWQENVAECMR